MNNLCFGQIIDPATGVLFPWYTHPILEIMSKWDLSDKTVFEWGSGSSSVWWAKKAKKVYTVEANLDWYMKLSLYKEEKHIDNLEIFYRQTNEGDQTKVDYYTEIPEGIEPDIIAVDGVLRYECMVKAMSLKRPLIMVVDNYQQDYVFMCPSADVLMEGVEMVRHIQHDHKDHSGNPWATAIFYIK